MNSSLPHQSSSVFSRLLAWMIDNPIASNLLMLTIIISGFMSFNTIRQETSPSFMVNEIAIEVNYPGATPADVEQSIVLAVEQKLRDNPDIDRLSAHISQGSAEISLTLNDGVSANFVLADVKNAIDAIDSFPSEMDTPTISLVQEYDSLIEIGLHGQLSEQELYRHAHQLKQQMLAQFDVARVDISGARTPEVVIEIAPEKLRQYQISINEVLEQVKAASIDVPAGSVATQSGNVLIRTLGRKELSQTYGDITIITDNLGGNVDLGQIAKISQDFNGQKQPFLVDGEPGLMLIVYQSKNAKPIEMSKQIIEFVNLTRAQLPSGLKLTLLQDEAEDYRQRVSLLTENGILGMVLVVLVLTLFLDFRLAFWVSMGIPLAIIGALGLMPLLELPINMITLFAFIISLGILVDDAVIVAENIYKKVGEGLSMEQALKQGAAEMAIPVLFSVTTNIIAFTPLLFVPGELGVMYKPMTLLIFAIFIVSLVEALFILPHHLRHINKPIPLTAIARIQQHSFGVFERIKNTCYLPLLRGAIKAPLPTVILFMSFAVVVFSYVASGRVELGFVPKVESTRIDAEIEFPSGTPLSVKERILSFVEGAGHVALARVGSKDSYKYSMIEIGASDAQATFRLLGDEQRDYSALEFVDAWRNSIGSVPGVKSLFFDYQVGPGGGKEIVIELGHKNSGKLNEATRYLMDQMRRINGITDIDSALVDGQLQYNVTPNALGKQLGFTSTSLGQSIRFHFYGGEALRQIVDGDEIKVRVLMSRKQHFYANQLEHLIVTTPNGQTVELGQVADISTTIASSSIERVDGIELVEVTASVLRQQAKSSLIMQALNDDVLNELAEQYPDLSIELGGSARIESKVNDEVVKGSLLALAIIFALLAIVLKSYIDAIIVLLVIPFCLCAAMLGHALLGHAFSVMSLFGMIGLAGIVINGAFVLRITLFNLYQQGMDDELAIEQAALNRFRPVVLTALTTAVGLVPMLFETSTQALYLIPMVISLSFGTLFSVIIILLLTPAMFSLKLKLVNWKLANTVTQTEFR